MEEKIWARVGLIAGFGVLFYCLYLLLPVLKPFIAAFILAYLLNPLVERLIARGLPRWAAISTVYLSIIAVVVVVGWFLIPMIWSQLMYAKEHIPDMIQWLNTNLRPWLRETLNIRTRLFDMDKITDMLVAYLQENYDIGATQNVLATVAISSMNILNVLGLVVLVPVVAFYFLLDWSGKKVALMKLIPNRAEPKVMQILAECDEVLTAFVKGQLLVMLLLGCVYAIGLQLTGLKIGLIIGMVAGLASIIPYLGFTIGLIASIAACFFQFGLDWMHLGLVLLVFFIGQIIEGYVLQPFLLGDKIGLSPVIVIFSVIAGAQLLGFVGMLLALPLAAVMAVLIGHLFDSYQNTLFYRRPPSRVQEGGQLSEQLLTLEEETPEGIHDVPLTVELTTIPPADKA